MADHVKQIEGETLTPQGVQIALASNGGVYYAAILVHMQEGKTMIIPIDVEGSDDFIAAIRQTVEQARTENARAQVQARS